ncbi:MAG: HEAT repeat domain-containing protein [Candidatus Kariarchaeaceae archaeon]|jgi:hypothetical protein
MSHSAFDLKELQESVIGVPKDLILPEEEEYVDESRDQRQKSIRKIIEMYQSSRKNNRVFKHTYTALYDTNPFVRVAAADIIGDTGNKNSFDYLFKALEDEEYVHVKQRIVTAIDCLEKRISNKERPEEVESTFSESMRILSYTL